MLDLAGFQLSDDEAELLRRPAVGGVILFSRNYRDPQQLIFLTDQIRRIRPELLIAVDHEGGRVQRFRAGFTRIPAMASLTRLWQRDPAAGLALARDCGWLYASELLAHGLDISFAPVLDMDRGISEVIGDRSFGADADTVIALAAELMQGMHEAGMATTGKHFPGHGAVAADSHLEMPVDERSYDRIEGEDLLPFARFARAESSPKGDRALMDAVMPAHVVYSNCDPQPAGFSDFWLQQVLRRDLGFDGMIFSDDLSMAGAEIAGGYAERADAALQAGCDMVLVCNQPKAARLVLNWLEQQGRLEAPRVLQMKAQARLTLEQLQAEPRWRACCEQLQRLEE
ncbi:beta-N-acetylhexosaminidase [Motiliproteus coralliicola]|uniref:Beta-hexosaminidase n=2 Tax=Motiliproteus coralliicola TaxID=2283196 RepID=A0A369WT53_9GAMM|nr:beta-N-acetylhexosaminidase [Motiliproteus coralliicola]